MSAEGAQNGDASEQPATRLIAWWRTHASSVLRLSVRAMTAVAAGWLTYQFWRLLFQTGEWGAIDLLYLQTGTRSWFAGDPVYPAYPFATYPPASYALLWPLIGWMGPVAVRWFWAATTLACLAWLIRIVLRASGATRAIDRRFIAMLPLAMYATGAAIGNGQLTNHILPCLISALLLLRNEGRSLQKDLLGSALFVFALVKPSVTAPFFGIALFAVGRIRPAILIGSGYLALTLLASWFQPEGPITLMLQWQATAHEAMYTAPVFTNSSGNLHSLFHSLDIDDWLTAASLGLLGTLLAWIASHRRGDLWGMMSVCAFASLFHTYHGWYDDSLLLIPMIALYRIATEADERPVLRAAGGALMAATLLSTLAPGGEHLFSSPLRDVYISGQVSVWLCVLAFLMRHVAVTHRATSRRALSVT